MVTITPRNSESVRGFETLTRDFGAGISNPFQFLITTQDDVMSQAFFDDAKDLIIDFTNRAGEVSLDHDCLGVISRKILAV